VHLKADPTSACKLQKIQNHSLVAIQRPFMPAFCVVAIQKAAEWPPVTTRDQGVTLAS
jgi:hypothetical protein